MKDWFIEKQVGRNLLRHKCKKDTEGVRQVRTSLDGLPVQYWCSYDKEDEWFCELCHTPAPKEIGFIADLARCVPLNTYPHIVEDE